MKNIKLNQSTRNEIKNAVLEAYSRNYFKDTPFFDINDLRNAKAKAYKKGMGSAWYKAYGAFTFHIGQIPKAILSKASFSIAVENRQDLAKSLTDPQFPGNSLGVDIVLTLEEHDDLLGDYVEIQKMEDQFIYEQNSFGKEVSQLLESVSTTRQLIDIWPNVEQHIPEHLCNPDKRFLPAIRGEDLDAKLS